MFVADTPPWCAESVSEVELRQKEKRVSSGMSGRAAVLAVAALLTSAAAASAQSDIVLQASKPSAKAGKWAVVSDSSAAGGAKIRHADGGATKVKKAKASPANYFELTVHATKGVGYRLWLHGRAEGDDWDNDSVFVQFSNSVNPSGDAVYRIGTTSATEVNLEECKGCGLKSAWKWQDNGWGKGVMGSLIYFASTGTQKLRVQTREDGLAIDQIVLSPAEYLKAPPKGVEAPDASGGSDDSDGTTSSSSSTGTQVKFLDWNIHHGVGTDGDYDLGRIADVIARSGANVVSLNEVEKHTGWGNEDQPARFASLLKSKTGKKWYYTFAQRDGNTNGQGNLILSTFEFESDGDYQLSYSRAVARAAIVVNGIRVNVFSTHLDAESSSRRTAQMKQLKSWADNYPEQRIIAGDFNAWPGAGEVKNMTADYKDSWAQAQARDIDVAYSGNAAGNTRNSRIDYIWYSEGAARLKLKQVKVFDVRDSKGVMPSDHRPLMATFEVK
jgi:endonuclease/exonuclease/phosphatase family metal-dependent hydrolase